MDVQDLYLAQSNKQHCDKMRVGESPVAYEPGAPRTVPSTRTCLLCVHVSPLLTTRRLVPLTVCVCVRVCVVVLQV